MVPAPGEPGSETWPKGEQWKTGGAPVWVTGNYDPATNLAYWGTGNGGPWMGDQRPGDNLYTASTVALDVAHRADQGPLPVPPERLVGLGRGVAADPHRLPARRPHREGPRSTSRATATCGFSSAAAGPIGFVEGMPYVKQNVFRGLDPKTGRPDVDPDRKPGTGKKVDDFCPSHWGGKNWPPIAFSPKTRMIYIPANENLCDWLTGNEVEYEAGERFIGATSGLQIVPGADHIGEVQAWNVDTGQRVWTHNYPTSPNWGPMLATAGGLVFSGGTNDRKFHAFDAASGKLLWEFPTNSGIIGAADVVLPSTASSTSPCSRAGASTRAACRAASTRSPRAAIPRCPRAAPSGSSRCLRRLTPGRSAPVGRGRRLACPVSRRVCVVLDAGVPSRFVWRTS